MRFAYVVGLASLAACAMASDVAVLDDSYVYDPVWNFQTGVSLQTARQILQSRGGNVVQLSDLTAATLAGKSVLFVSKLGSKSFTPAQIAAVQTWVQGGGTLISTAECSCYGNHILYNELLAPYGLSYSGAVIYGFGNVLVNHPLTQGLSQVYIAKNGYLDTPPEATKLINDPNGNTFCALLQGTASTGAGRVLAIGDTDMFSTLYLGIETTDFKFFSNIATWALNPAVTLTGKVTAKGYTGSLVGLPLEIRCYDGGNLSGTKYGVLDSEGNYFVSFDQPGTCDMVAKLPMLLSLRQNDVVLSQSAGLDWNFEHNGDATNDNMVDILDLNEMLVYFDVRGVMRADVNGDGVCDLFDLNLALINFGGFGD